MTLAHIIGDGLLGLCLFVSACTVLFPHYKPRIKSPRGDASDQSQSNLSEDPHHAHTQG